MSQLKYVAAMLAAGGTVAGAAPALASVTLTLNIPASTDITTPGAVVYLAGASVPQYVYGSFDSVPTLDPSKLVAGDSGLLDAIFFTSDKTDLGIQLGESSTLGVLSFSQWNSHFKAGDPALVFKVPSGNFLPANIAYTVTGGPDSVLSGVDQYVYLLFNTDAGTSGDLYFGAAHINAGGVLDSVTYDAIPEPESWALMVAGVGLAGAGLRRRRRQASAKA